jgi:hypothetical protein
MDHICETVLHTTVVPHSVQYVHMQIAIELKSTGGSARIHMDVPYNVFFPQFLKPYCSISHDVAVSKGIAVPAAMPEEAVPAEAAVQVLWEVPAAANEIPEYQFAPHSSGTMIDGTTVDIAQREDDGGRLRDADCPVCMETTALLVIVPCGHMVCACCWLGCRDKCPLCRCRGTGLRMRWP